MFMGSLANPEINPDPIVVTGAIRCFRNLTEPCPGMNSMASIPLGGFSVTRFDYDRA